MGKSVLFKRLPKILVLQRRVARVQRPRKRRLRVSRSAAVPGEQLGPGGEGKREGGGLEAAIISRARSECQPAEQSMVAEQSSRTGCCCWALARTLRGAKHLGLHVKLVKV